jgi:ankyrin repeat protein
VPLDQNRKLWTAIHDHIRTNALEQLMTLLSQNTINLNCFNLSRDGDTILHSAAKSNDVKMMEFVLQRISPSTRERMLKTKNYQQQLPVDLLATWAPSIHSLFPLKFRQVVKTVLMLGAKRQDGTPYYPQTHFYKLPKDVLFLILQYAASNTGHPKDTSKSKVEQPEATDNKKRKREET